MAVLITGATGMIGRVLTGSLAAAGLDIRVLTRRPHRPAQLFGDSVSAFEWHPISEPVPAAAMDGVDTIVHLMGAPLDGAPTPQMRLALTTSRVKATGRLIEAMDAKPIRLITASSAAIYDASPMDGVSETVDEGSPLGSPAGFVQGIVRDWEAAAAPLREIGGEAAHLRLGLVIAPGAFPAPIVALHENWCAITLADTCAIPVIALEDAAAMFAWLVLNPAINGPVNAVAPNTLTGTALNDALAAKPGARRRLALPQWLARRMLGLKGDLIFGNRRIAPRRALEAGFSFSHPDPLPSLIEACTKQEAAILAARNDQKPPWLREADMSQMQTREKTVSADKPIK